MPRSHEFIFHVCIGSYQKGGLLPVIPPGKDRWLATPISLGLSWPRILSHLLEVAGAIDPFTMV